MLSALTVLIMLAAAYAYMVEGVFTALTMLINVLIAGIVAFNFWEPLAAYLDPMFFGTFLEGYEDALCMVGVFWLVLLCLRVATTQFASAEIELNTGVQRGGGALFGLLTGYLASGFLVCMLQTLPWQVNFLGYEPGYHNDQIVRTYIPADRMWLALMHRAGAYGFSNGEETFDPHCNFELRYARYRRLRPGETKAIPYYGEFDANNYVPNEGGGTPGPDAGASLNTGGTHP